MLSVLWSEPLLSLVAIPMVKIGVIFTVLMLIVAYLTFAERKILAYLQVRIGPNRVGPRGWLQPIADGLKLFVKEDLVPSGSQKFVFLLAPCLIIVPALLVWSVIPFGEPFQVAGVEVHQVISDINIGVLFILGVSTIGVYGLILGGWSSNSKFSLMGGLRSAAQMISYEVPLGFAVVSAVLMAGSLSLVEIVRAQQEAHLWFFLPGILALGLYFVCGVAETNRNPFDLPEAESELVAGFHTEYSGMKFALFFLAEYANMMVVASLATILFFGGWLPPFPNVGFLSFLDVIPGVVWFLAKVAAFMYCYIWFRGTFPRYRFDQLMRVGWKWLIPLSLVNIMLVAGLRLVVLLMKG
jgi:NADH-quinone oxidoreductase subunit H